MDEDGYFGEPVAARYDQSVADMSGPGAVDPAVDFLAGLAGDGQPWSWASGRGVSPCRWRAAACPCTGSTSPGRWWPGCGTSRAAMRSA